MPVDPFTAAAAGMSVLSSGVKMYQGIRQQSKGRKLEESLERPTYQIPGYIQQNLDEAEKMANVGIPEAQRNAYLDQLSRQGTSSLQNFRGRKAGLMGAEIVGQQSLDAQRELRIADIQKRLENQRLAMAARSIMANYQDKAFQLNELNPYQNDMNYARSLQGAGMQNQMTALSDLTGAASTFASGYLQSGGGIGSGTKSGTNP